MHQTKPTHNNSKETSCCDASDPADAHNVDHAVSEEKTYLDPVCGMSVKKNPEKTARSPCLPHRNRQGQNHEF